jgi:hypothetical protein
MPGGRVVLQTLEGYHAEIEAMIVEGEVLVAARDPATARRVKRRVADSMLLVASYQLFVHRNVFNIKDFLADETPLNWDITQAKMAWFNGRLKKHIADVRQLMSPDLSKAQHAALMARRIGTVGPSVAA